MIRTILLSVILAAVIAFSSQAFADDALQREILNELYEMNYQHRLDSIDRDYYANMALIDRQYRTYDRGYVFGPDYSGYIFGQDYSPGYDFNYGPPQ